MTMSFMWWIRNGSVLTSVASVRASPSSFCHILDFYVCESDCVELWVAAIQCAYCPLHVQTQLLDWTPRCFNTAESLCDSVCYKRNQLLHIEPARLTPDIIGHLRRLGTGLNLPRKRTRRGGSRKQRKIAVLDCDNCRRPSSTTCKQQAHEHGNVNFNNLITVLFCPVISNASL